MIRQKILFIKTLPDAVIPEFDSSGVFSFKTRAEFTLPANTGLEVSLGLKILIPPNCLLLPMNPLKEDYQTVPLFSDSVSKDPFITNRFRGEIKVLLFSNISSDLVIPANTTVLECILFPLLVCDFFGVLSFPETWNGYSTNTLMDVLLQVNDLNQGNKVDNITLT